MTDCRLKLAAFALCGFYRASMLIIPAKKLESHFGNKGEESKLTESKRNYYHAKRIARVVNEVAAKTPWESKCLVRALTVRYLLKRKGISYTLYLGVGKDDRGNMVAHSWIRSGEFLASGGDGTGFATVAKFAG